MAWYNAKGEPAAGAQDAENAFAKASAPLPITRRESPLYYAVGIVASAEALPSPSEQRCGVWVPRGTHVQMGRDHHYGGWASPILHVDVNERRRKVDREILAPREPASWGYYYVYYLHKLQLIRHAGAAIARRSAEARKAAGHYPRGRRRQRG